MTAPDQTEAAERATRELAKRIRQVVPASFLADPDAFAARFIADMLAENWRPWPRPAVITATRPGPQANPPADELDAVRRACETASDKHHRKEDHA